MNNASLSGQIDLLAINGARFDNGNIIIPSSNPSVFVCDTKSGQRKAYLDIVIRESPNNQYGNTHFVKASVGRSNRERLGISREELQKYTPIIGNLKTLEAAPQQGSAGSREPVDIMGDMPADCFQGF